MMSAYKEPSDWNRVFIALNAAEQKAEERLGHTYEAAVATGNRLKNRWMNVLPYDKTRVTLDGDRDYINANMVKIDDEQFICTQGQWRLRIPYTVAQL